MLTLCSLMLFTGVEFDANHCFGVDTSRCCGVGCDPL